MKAVKVFAARVAKEVLGRLLALSGLYRRELENVAIVVAFHSVTRNTTDGALRCSEKDFDQYCGFFSRYLNVEPLSRLIDRMHSGGSIPGGTLCITFDDGYADNAEIAAPVLARWKLPALFFVATDFIGSTTQTFWDAKAGVESRWMTWSQVQQLVSGGHEIGAHTRSHADLAKLDPQQIRDELAGSRDAIAGHLGSAPPHFAVPFGRGFESMPVVSSIARELGFRSVSLCRGGLVPKQADTLCFERWPVDPGQYISPFGWLFDVVKEARRQAGGNDPAGYRRLSRAT